MCACQGSSFVLKRNVNSLTVDFRGDYMLEVRERWGQLGTLLCLGEETAILCVQETLMATLLWESRPPRPAVGTLSLQLPAACGQDSLPAWPGQEHAPAFQSPWSP